MKSLLCAEYCSTSHKEHHTNPVIRQLQKQAGHKGAKRETILSLALLGEWKGEGRGKGDKQELSSYCSTSPFIKKKMLGICGEKAAVPLFILKYRGADCSCLLCLPRTIKERKFPPSCLH